MSEPEIKCDCPACTGTYTPHHLEMSRASIKAGLAAGKLIYNHLHGDNGKLFDPVGISACANLVLGPKVPNMIVQMLDLEVQFPIINGVINGFLSDKLVLANHMTIGSEYTGLSVPVRLLKVDRSHLPDHLKNFEEVAYEGRTQEDLYQMIFPDAAGKFPDEFGYNHAGMAWNKPLGDL